MRRRDFLKSGVAGAACAAAGGFPGLKAKALGGPQAAPAAPALPTVRLGKLEVSRFILGSNPFWGYSHKSEALDAEMKRHYTDERIIQILDEAAECGVTAVASPPDERWIKLWARYRDRGGRLKIWISQCHGNAGADAQRDRPLGQRPAPRPSSSRARGSRSSSTPGHFDVLRSWIEHIKEAGLPAGCGRPLARDPSRARTRKFPTDFYYQCFYNVVQDRGLQRRRAGKGRGRRSTVEKPVIAYKILGAGRLPASEGFEFAFNRIRRKDGVCVGIFAQKAIDQIRQNATYTGLLSA